MRKLNAIFREINLHGRTESHAVPVDVAYEYAKKSGDDTKGPMWFVLEPESDTPTVYPESKLKFIK